MEGLVPFSANALLLTVLLLAVTKFFLHVVVTCVASSSPAEESDGDDQQHHVARHVFKEQLGCHQKAATSNSPLLSLTAAIMTLQGVAISCKLDCPAKYKEHFFPFAFFILQYGRPSMSSAITEEGDQEASSWKEKDGIAPHLFVAYYCIAVVSLHAAGWTVVYLIQKWSRKEEGSDCEAGSEASFGFWRSWYPEWHAALALASASAAITSNILVISADRKLAALIIATVHLIFLVFLAVFLFITWRLFQDTFTWRPLRNIAQLKNWEKIDNDGDGVM